MATFRDRHGEPVVTETDEPIVYHGEELTDDRAEEIAEEAIRKLRARNLVPGGKSLSGGGEHSPTVQFRVPAELRRRLDERADAEHRSASRIAREALGRYLAS